MRERLVLGQVRTVLREGERVTRWAHVHDPKDARPGVVAVTPVRLLVQWSEDQEDVVLAWDELTAWDIEQARDGSPVLALETCDGRVEVALPVTSSARARAASELLSGVAEHATTGATVPAGFPRGDAPSFVADPRGVRGHVRRIVLTVAGASVIALGLLFASPFVPGPGALTVLAGLAILAKEYEWAKDVHLWFRRKADRFLARWRARRDRRRLQRVTARESMPEA
jgi:uncharacterized protein (TIGR02611 family)